MELILTSKFSIFFTLFLKFFFFLLRIGILIDANICDSIYLLQTYREDTCINLYLQQWSL